MVWVVGFRVVSTEAIALGGARRNRHGDRRRFPSGPRRAPVAPRTRLAVPVAVRGHPRRQRATANRIRRNRECHPNGRLSCSDYHLRCAWYGWYASLRFFSFVCICSNSGLPDYFLAMFTALVFAEPLAGFRITSGPADASARVRLGRSTKVRNSFEYFEFQPMQKEGTGSTATPAPKHALLGANSNSISHARRLRTGQLHYLYAVLATFAPRRLGVQDRLILTNVQCRHCLSG